MWKNRFFEKWRGPGLALVGLVLLAIQVVLYISLGVLHSLLIGPGIGFVICGLLLWFYFWDDQFAGADEPNFFNSTNEEEEFDADEYSRRFDFLDDADSQDLE